MNELENGPILAKDLATDEVKTRPKAKNPVRICDTTFRDGHQSTLATRMRTGDMEWMAAEMDRCGFYSMEVWGGATFDVAHRFLGEDPWDRPRKLKKLMPNTPLQMLLRGQNLVAYRNYPDDVVDAFVDQAVEVGIDIFRVFDALNDERNHERAARAIKRCGKHYQGAICYSLTQPRMGGPIYNLEYYLKKALILREMGADSICVKDQAGLISPYDAFDLVKALKENLKIPVNLHTHYTTGQASMSVLKAIEAGVDIVDAALSPFALRSSEPAVEPLVVALYGTNRDTGLDIEQLLKCVQMLEQVAPKYRDFLDSSAMSVIDTGALLHQIPGGMTTNLVAQLRQLNALDKLSEVREETARIRAEFGYPPLVTPTSQIVGAQAVQNVLIGRYKLLSNEAREYLSGGYGKPPSAVAPDIQKSVLRDKVPITGRPADLLGPELEKAKEESKEFARNVQDVLTYVLFPTTGPRFLKYKYGIDRTIPDDWKPPRAPKTLEEVKKEDELIAQVKSGRLKGSERKPSRKKEKAKGNRPSM